MLSLNRRHFLTAGCLGVGSLLLGSVPFFSGKVLKIAVSGELWKNRPWLLPLLTNANEHLQSVSGGHWALEVQLTKAYQEKVTGFDAVLSSPSLYASPVSAFLGHMPLPLNADEKSSWLQREDVSFVWSQFHQAQGLVPVLVGAGESHFGFLSTLEDLDAREISPLRFTSSRDLTRQCIESLGGKTFKLKGRNARRALAGGQVDVSEAFSHRFWLTSGLHQTPGYHYYANEWSGAQVFNLLFDGQAWSQLAHEEQQMIRQTFQKNSPFVSAALKNESQRSLLEIKKTASHVVQEAQKLQDAMMAGYSQIVESLGQRNHVVKLLSESLNHFLALRLRTF